MLVKFYSAAVGVLSEKEFQNASSTFPGTHCRPCSVISSVGPEGAISRQDVEWTIPVSPRGTTGSN